MEKSDKQQIFAESSPVSFFPADKSWCWRRLQSVCVFQRSERKTLLLLIAAVRVLSLASVYLCVSAAGSEDAALAERRCPGAGADVSLSVCFSGRIGRRCSC